jgi:PAS domain S-box-containing protein
LRGNSVHANDPGYRSLFEFAVDGMLLFDASGEILDANLRACEMLGVSRQSLTGYLLPELMATIGTEWDSFVARLLEEGSLRGEVRFSRAVGERSTAEASFSVCESTNERIGAILRSSDDRYGLGRPQSVGTVPERYHSVLQYTSEVVVVVDARGEILYQSTTTEDVLGYRPGALVGGSALDYVHPEDRERMARGSAEILAAPERRLTEEFRLRHSDGSWRHFEGTMINRMNATDIGGLIISYRDITERKQVENSLRRSLDVLLALREAGYTLGSTLKPDEIGTRLLGIMKRISSLTTAVVSVPDENRELQVWQSIGFESLWKKARYTPEAQSTLYSALETGERQMFRLESPDSEHSSLVGMCLPLRRRGWVLGVLEIYGPNSLQEGDTLDILESLTGQAASALENARLYRELSEREQRLQELVGQLLRTQEEERRRVSYEVHDGLAQTAAAAHQHLQAFARFHSPDSPDGQELLKNSVDLAHRTVGEARRVIADLRPTALDDFGLHTALRLEVEKLAPEGSEGGEIEYEGNVREEQRLPVAVETGLFRIAQEALTNARKHAGVSKIRLTLERIEDNVRLVVRDWGLGFDVGSLSDSGPGERVGISSMQQRASILGGKFEIESNPEAGTAIVVEVPLPADDEFSGQEAERYEH